MADEQPLTLAIDSVADAASLALLRGDEVLAAHHWTATETMSRELLPAIADLLASTGIEREAIERIAVDTGPGQYGALRIGVSTAQGLALALDVPLAGVGRFEADAFAHVDSGRAVIAVHDAGRSGTAWAAYERGDDGLPRELIAPRLDEPADLAGLVPAEALWCGELTDALREATGLEEAPAAGQPRAVNLGRIAHRRASFGDPAEVDAVYLRPPPITQPR